MRTEVLGWMIDLWRESTTSEERNVIEPIKAQVTTPNLIKRRNTIPAS